MKFVPVIGRVLYSLAFILFGFNHLTAGEGMSGMVPGFLPFPTAIVYLTGILIIAGGLMIIAGYRARLAGLVLALFVISTAVFVHLSGFLAGDQVATASFLKDLSMAGGGLLIYHFGAGPMSMDAKAGESPDIG